MDTLLAFYLGLVIGVSVGFVLASAIAIGRGSPNIDRDAADLYH